MNYLLHFMMKIFCACHNAIERVVNCKTVVVNVERVVDSKKLLASVKNS